MRILKTIKFIADDMIKPTTPRKADLLSLDVESSTNPLTAEDLTIIMADPFKIGTFFLKYRAIRDPAIRFIWISVEGDRLCWSKPEEKHLRTKIRGYLNISDIVRIKDGLERTRGLPKNDKDLRLLCSFSVVTADTTIELEAPTRKVKNDWMNHLCTLICG